MNNYRWNKWNRFTSKARIVTLGAVRLYIRQHEQWRWSIRSAFHAGQSENRRRRWFHTGDFCDRVVRLSFQLHAQRTATKFLWWRLDFGITWKRENFGISTCFSFSSDLQLPPANSSFCAIALRKQNVLVQFALLYLLVLAYYNLIVSLNVFYYSSIIRPRYQISLFFFFFLY